MPDLPVEDEDKDLSDWDDDYDISEVYKNTRNNGSNMNKSAIFKSSYTRDQKNISSNDWCNNSFRNLKETPRIDMKRTSTSMVYNGSNNELQERARSSSKHHR